MGTALFNPLIIDYNAYNLFNNKFLNLRINFELLFYNFSILFLD